jgi:hypothetical protein
MINHLITKLKNANEVAGGEGAVTVANNRRPPDELFSEFSYLFWLVSSMDPDFESTMEFSKYISNHPVSEDK